MCEQYDLSQAELSAVIASKWAGKELVYYDETTSTNIVADELARKGAVHGTLVVADSQSQGRGRRGRSWISPAGRDIYMTLLLRPECRLENVSALTLVMALSVLQSIEAVTALKPVIKWPNDIVINGKKVCGILTEMNIEGENQFYVITGVGINCNQTEFDTKIKGMATSLLLEGGQRIERKQLIAEIMLNFEKNYKVFQKTQDLSLLKPAYNQSLVNMNREVRVLDLKEEFTGVSRGINDKGELLVDTKDGETVRVYAGEVSVRGIYGYV